MTFRSIIFLLLIQPCLALGLLSQTVVNSFSPEKYGFNPGTEKKIDPIFQGLLLLPTEEISAYKEITPTEKTKNGKIKISALIKTTDISSIKSLKGIEVGSVAGNIITARFELDDLKTIANLESVQYIEAARILFSTLDSSTNSINANDVWNFTYNNTPFKGKNVLIGIIDSGIDWKHKDFVENDSESQNVWNSKIQFIWDQLEDNDPSCSPPSGYNYGREYNNEMINNAIRNNINLATIDNNGHGSHVAGIAASDGSSTNGIYSGVAPESKLIICKFSDGIDNYMANSTVGLLDALSWMINKASLLDLPLIVNLSQGIRTGPHDGSTLLEEAINYKIQYDSLRIVISAGNDIRNIYSHAQKTILPGNDHEFKIDLFSKNPSLQFRFIQFWYNHDDNFNIRIKPDNFLASWSDPIPLNTNMQTITFGPDGMYGQVTVTHKDCVFNTMNKQVDINIYYLGSFPFCTTNWLIKFFDNDSLLNQPVDGYLERNVNEYAHFMEDGTSNGTINLPGSCANAMTVAGYITKVSWNSIKGPQYDEGYTLNEISARSSKGPLRNEIISSKPDLTAPGQRITSVKSSYSNADSTEIIDEYPSKQHVVMLGTSMASPHVAGAVALLLQQFRYLSPADCKTILKESASDYAPAPGDSTDWGSGKLNILAAYKSMVGFDYSPHSYDSIKFQNAFKYSYLTGLPIEPVKSDWGGSELFKQKLSNGAIFLSYQNDSAYWIGEGIWNEWIALDSTQSLIGLPVSKEFIDPNTWEDPTTYFQNGKIYWSSNQAFVIYYFAGFTADQKDGNIPFTVQFTDTSFISPGGLVTSWLWDFGDGTTSTNQNPVHAYETVGSFTVSLKIYDNNYSFKCSRHNYITTFSSPCSTMLVKAEYFLDSDPGMGNGIPVAFEPAQFIDTSFNVSLASVSPGLHRLYFRALDDSNRWGLPNYRQIYVQGNQSINSLPNITRIEYFFDTLVPIGNGIPLTFSPNPDMTLNKNINLSMVQQGLHRLYFRAKNANGKWSLIYSKQVYVRQTADNSLPKITRVEYFMDSLVPPGQGTMLNTGQGTNLTISKNIDLTTISAGLHQIYFRTKDEEGLWSVIHSKPFMVRTLPEGNFLPDITRVEYFFDSDPGLGNGTSLSMITGDSVQIETTIPLNNLGSGLHRLYFRARDAQNFWSLPQYSEFGIDIHLCLKLFLEGIYKTDTTLLKAKNETGSQFSGSTADQITLEIRDANSPFNLADSCIIVDIDTTGIGEVTIPYTLTQSYYFVIKHRNSIETWSSLPISLDTDSIYYDFSDSISSAYGNNLKLVGNRYTIFGGDVNQDGFVNLSDMQQTANDASSFLLGYRPTDVNGDGKIDALDLIIIDNNILNSVSTKRP
jgi:PKD repeat protein/subtilisin family serine protease